MTKCFFSNLQKITIAELRNAKKSVYIAVAWINFDIYFPVFAELLSQGICVQIIINDDANNARYRNQIENLILQGAKITLINAIGIMHHKFCVIDENQCIFGFVIIHAVGMPGARMYGRHEEELFYQIIWKERGMEQYIPDEIPRDE